MNSILDDFKMAFRSGNILNQIIVINVLVFAGLLLIRFVFFFGEFDQAWDFTQSLFEFDPRPENLIYRPWTLLTYGFTHYDVFHILFNMLFLYWFGRVITDMLGQNKILGLYVWGVLAGSVLYLVMYSVFPRAQILGGTTPQMIGASAGVMAVMVGAATFQPEHRFQLFLIGRVKIVYIAAFYILMSVSGAMGSNSGGELAHIGGGILGYIFIRQMYKGNDWSRPVVSFIHWFKSFFKPQPKIKVSYKNEEKFGSKTKRKSSGSRRTKTKAKSAETSSQAEIDAILDKISEKGYDALSKEEKQKLFNASKQ